MTKLERRALQALESARGGVAADEFGAEMWPDRTGRVTASTGGGDYAAQMLLGRLRKRGWARVLPGDGSSRWALTTAGRRELALVGS